MRERGTDGPATAVSGSFGATAAATNAKGRVGAPTPSKDGHVYANGISTGVQIGEQAVFLAGQSLLVGKNP